MTQTAKNLFSEIASFEELWRGYRTVRKGKRYKKSVVRFSAELEQNLLDLSQELRERTYEPGGFKEFVLHDPKRRKIAAPLFRDRVVHRSLHRALEPVFEPSFIYDTFACRPGKGTHEAVDRLQYFMRKQDTSYYLQCDISSYFDSVDHDILLDCLRRQVDDEGVDWLVQTLLAQYSTDHGDRRGMPIGALYSQLFANVYLDQFDHFVKQSLQVPYYVRYMDDFVLLADSKADLHRWKDAMQGYLRETLDLSLPGRKTTLEPIEKGATFLGYRVYPRYRLVRQRNKRKFKRRLKTQKRKLQQGQISFSEIKQSINSWTGHASHADTANLQEAVLGKIAEF